MTESLSPYPRIILSGTDPDLPDQIPHGFERYQDFREITRAVKAVLHACWDPVIGRTIAMKSLLPQYAHDIVERRRFLREARVTAQLQHPNTVPVYDIGVDPNGGLYFTMKLLAGHNFFEILQRLSWGDPPTEQQYPLARQVDIIIQACQALSYAHQHGVIHRDIKPENIWIGEFGEVVLLDWGVSKVWGTQSDGMHIPLDQEQPPALENRPTGPLTRRDDDQLQTLTQTGSRPGTPLYMSPEQVVSSPLDERTDIFSMGVVIHELLIFREPYRGRTIEETFQQILHLKPTPPSEQRPERKIPKSLDEIVLKATQKKRDDRYQSMDEMIADLQAAELELSVKEGPHK